MNQGDGRIPQMQLLYPVSPSADSLTGDDRKGKFVTFAHGGRGFESPHRQLTFQKWDPTDGRSRLPYNVVYYYHISKSS